MALQQFRAAPQLSLLDAADEAAASIDSPGFDDWRPHFEAVAFDLDDLVTRLRQLSAEGREAFTARGSTQTWFEIAAKDVRRAHAAVRDGLARLRAGAQAMAAARHPGAARLDRVLSAGAPDLETPESTLAAVPSVLAAARREAEAGWCAGHPPRDPRTRREGSGVAASGRRRGDADRPGFTARGHDHVTQPTALEG